MSKHIHPLDDDSYGWLDGNSDEWQIFQLKLECLFFILSVIIVIVSSFIAFAAGDGGAFH
jgi:hypothetical protein